MSIETITSITTPHRSPSKRVNRYDFEQEVQDWYGVYFDYQDDLERCRQNTFQGKFTRKLRDDLIKENRLIQAAEHMVKFGVTFEDGHTEYYTKEQADELVFMFE